MNTTTKKLIDVSKEAEAKRKMLSDIEAASESTFHEKDTLSRALAVAEKTVTLQKTDLDEAVKSKIRRHFYLYLPSLHIESALRYKTYAIVLIDKFPRSIFSTRIEYEVVKVAHQRTQMRVDLLEKEKRQLVHKFNRMRSGLETVGHESYRNTFDDGMIYFASVNTLPCLLLFCALLTPYL